MQFKKLSAPSLKELFVEEIESKILSGELAIGEKLPSERELANTMQVSRAVINAGIIELEQKGFLVIQPRIGNFVADYRKNGSLNTLVSIMRYNGGALANEEVRSILELRIVLVNLAASLAVDRATDEEYSALHTILETAQKCTTPEQLTEETFHFYHELGVISGNSLLPLLFNSFKELVCTLWLRYILNYGMDALNHTTEEFYRLLVCRDKEAATHYVEVTTQNTIDGTKTIYL